MSDQRQGLDHLLPHKPPMVLLDSIIAHDATKILCRTKSHLDTANPLRIDGFLSVYCGVEYAAQAMAAHARLYSEAKGAPRQGVVAVASKLTPHCEKLDAYPDDLLVKLHLLARNDSSSMCEFELSAQQMILLTGQLTASLTPPHNETTPD
ncbi:hypothetical protein [Gilvimarinus chinensis]|uniref:hypothetical protein n=1 Tax=Gilvimarinus chinensis TaxID=396005 RepID=UPI0003A9D980|nr:hypothetical protein [Gilvimarinus chinensis]